MSKRIPVTVLTGFLGSGKTTLLNRILSEHHGKRYAVVVNEFGEAGIDNDLVVGADEEVFEMNNGCICCTVRGDLIRILGGLLRRRSRFDGILIETTGLADPAPVAQTFFVDEDIREAAELDAVVTVADAWHLPRQLEDSHEAAEQLGFADIILLNKVDLIDDATLDAVEARIQRINPQAVVHRTRQCDLPIEQVLGRGAFDLDRILTLEPDFLDTSHDHEHDEAVRSVNLVSERPLDPQRFDDWMSRVLMEQGVDILRCKGILAMHGDDRRFVFQGVHMLSAGAPTVPWQAHEPRTSRLVFIGRNLDDSELRAGFEACST